MVSLLWCQEPNRPPESFPSPSTQGLWFPVTPLQHTHSVLSPPWAGLEGHGDKGKLRREARGLCGDPGAGQRGRNCLFRWLRETAHHAWSGATGGALTLALRP